MCSPSKRVGLRRQACLEVSTDQPLDPWVKLTESPENQSFCSKNMSDHNGDAEVVSTASETTNVTSDSKCEQPHNVKKGPPVAPKSAWVRQSLKSIKSGKPIKEAVKHQDNRSHDTGRTFGISLRAASSGANLSIRQKISSFETFSSADGAERPNWRPAPTASLPPMEKTAKNSSADYSNAERTKVNSRNLHNIDNCQSTPTTISATAQPPEEEEEQSASLSPDVLSEPHPTEEEKQTSEDSEPCKPIPVEEPALDSKEPPPAAENGQEPLPSQEDSPPSSHVPRRSSSSKEGLSEKPEGAGTHAVSVRTRSLPLSPSSETPNSSGLEGESLGIILSFSNQVSNALMRSMQSLPQSPCIRTGNPWSAPSGSTLHNPIEEDSSAENPSPSPAVENSERGFSVRYVAYPSILLSL